MPTPSIGSRDVGAHQREQSPISCPEVEHSPDPLWQRFQQQLLGDVAVRYLAGEVLGDTLRIGPLAQHPPNQGVTRSLTQKQRNCCRSG